MERTTGGEVGPRLCSASGGSMVAFSAPGGMLDVASGFGGGVSDIRVARLRKRNRGGGGPSDGENCGWLEESAAGAARFGAGGAEGCILEVVVRPGGSSECVHIALNPCHSGMP